jgi:hypothetical protein
MKSNNPISQLKFNKANQMAKMTFTPNPKVHTIFDDLERYYEFCQDFGYRFNESDLYNWKSYAYQQYSKFAQGKFAKDMWIVDRRR